MHRITQLSLSRPWQVLAIIVGLSAIFGYGAANVKEVTGFRTFLGDDDPEMNYLDEFIERYGGGFPLLMVYSCTDGAPCDTVFDAAPLEMAHTIGQRLGKMDGVRGVDSPADSTVMVPIDDFLEKQQIYGSDDPGPAIAAAIASPLWKRNILSQDGKVGALIVHFASSDPDLQKTVTLRALELIEPYERDGYAFRMVGESVDFTIAPYAIKNESGRVMPVLVVVLMGVLYVLFRSIAAVLISIATMGLASLWSQGLLGLLDMPLDATTQNVPSVILAVGICNAVHVLARYAEDSTESANTRDARSQALLSVSNEIGSACLLTSLTTAVAFLSFFVSDFESFKNFGLITAFGVLAALMLTFTLLPILVALLPVSRLASTSASAFWADLSNALVGVTSQRPRVILAGALALLAIFAYGALDVVVETTHHSLIGERNVVVQWSDWVEENLRAPENLEVELVAPSGVSLDNVETLRVVDAVEAYLGTQLDGIGPTQSILGPLRHVNYLMHGRDDEYLGALPQTDPALFESFFMLPPMVVDLWTTTHRNHIRISAEARSMPTRQQDAIVRAVRSHLDVSLPAGWTYQLTGSLPIFSAMMNTMIETQIETFSVAFVMVFVCLIVYFRNFRLPALAMLPNVLPVIAALGVLGYWGTALDAGMAMTAAIVLGLAVDDTVHLFVQYGRFENMGNKPEAAMRMALAHVGRPLVSTSAALALGFLTLAVMSTFDAVANFGLLASVAIMVALAADLLIVPALAFSFPNIMRTRKLGGESK